MNTNIIQPGTALAAVLGLAIAGIPMLASAQTSSQAGSPPPPNAATQSGQMKAPFVGDEPVPKSQRWENYRSQSAGTPPPPPGTTQSGQMRSPFVGDEPATQPRQRGEMTQRQMRQQQSSAAAVTGSRVEYAGCTETSAGAVPLSETGQPATRALNVLMASGCTQFDNFRATSGIEWAADVPRGNGEQPVMVNPETGRIHFVRS